MDVREPSEYADGHVPGARCVPLSSRRRCQISDRLIAAAEARFQTFPIAGRSTEEVLRMPCTKCDVDLAGGATSPRTTRRPSPSRPPP
ncbi:rhodanese-like domain-containing protein [Micromonospora zhanjiangensis]